MTIKLDMEWVYDRMRWIFLEWTLHCYGFHDTWIRWIMACIRYASSTILINGTPSNYFQSMIGIHQGCSLSFYLFIYYADIHSWALRGWSAAHIWIFISQFQVPN